ncbi:MAG: nucleotide exchange factor GrpE, partial [Caldilineales bacterium]|nr:nucleotide exchange factor GrpE [Caldilineales bacterium]
HLELGLQHMAGLPQEDAVQLAGYSDNLSATLQAFLETLKRHGVVRMEAKGSEFNPDLHEAVGTANSDVVPEGQVIDVLQAGYLDDGSLLRPARVIVSLGP